MSYCNASGSCPPNVFINTVESIANEINLELDDSSVNIPYICKLIKNNMGAVNGMLYSDYELTPNLQFCPPIHPIVKDIVKLNFYLRYYEKKSRCLLLTIGANHILSLADGKSKVTMESGANLARAWKMLIDEIKTLLDERVDFYKKGLCSAVSVVGLPPLYGYSVYGGLEIVLTPLAWGNNIINAPAPIVGP